MRQEKKLPAKTNRIFSFDLALGVPGYLWTKLTNFVEALLKPDTIIIDIETTNNPWIRISTQKLIGFKDGIYEDINQIKNKP